jgi:hypothetical protein
MVETIPKFYSLGTRAQFEIAHEETCQRILTSFKTNRGDTLSYGQAQKPLNVFLKVYIDWANQPDRTFADKLAPFLHVPLDSVVMEFIAREFPQEYQTGILSLRKRIAELVSERLEKTTPRMVERMLLRSEFALVGLSKEMYLAWQKLLRKLYPAKPVLLDIIGSWSARVFVQGPPTQA